ncbi:MAG: hypothetical protein IJS08_00250 [Victivallales bacterium]|nr:hypothetical protein [Victivallales bacterium]
MQLKMYFFPERDEIPQLEVPEGFEIRALKHGDEEQYLAMRPMSGFTEWDRAKLDEYLNGPAKKVMLIVDKASGTFAQAASAEAYIEEGTGQFGWLLSNPAYRGRGLGRPISIATMQALKEVGFKRFVIFTDDFRVPALRIYLKLGWHPVYHADDMEGRWDAIGKQLQLDFTPTDANGILLPPRRFS